jgi:AraC-like DNA-binding protein
MINIEFIENNNELYIPKRLMKYILIYCVDGNLVLVVDEKELFLKTNDILTITSGQYHYFKNTENAKGIILEFTLDYFCKSDNDIELIFHNGLFCHFDLNEVIDIGKHSDIYEQLCLIKEEIATKPFQFHTSIHARIVLILTAINRAKISHGDEIWKPDALFLKFLEMVRNNFTHNYSLHSIAEQLNTTVSKLNELSKLHAGKTAQNVIYGLKISEAKRLLQYEKMTVKEIAYNIGFNDPFYFSNFFRKNTGISPKMFQKQFAL